MLDSNLGPPALRTSFLTWLGSFRLRKNHPHNADPCVSMTALTGILFLCSDTGPERA